MLFNSYIFILLFLPITLVGYFLINNFGKYQAANVFLILMSLWFYGYYNPKYLPVILTSILLNYLLSRGISLSTKSSTSKMLLLLGIIGNSASIFYFKYFNLFMETANHISGTSFEIRKIVLPLGISFFTFQQISFLVDTYNGETADYGFVEYALFIAYFPQLIAGPIVLHQEMIPQFREQKKRRKNYVNLSRGLFIFALGLSKKVLIADVLSVAVNWGYNTIDTLSSLEALIVSISYLFQLYFDFSGYCDMAIGIGYMFNIELPQNFNSPYKACSIVEFWERWHLTLTRFLRKYVYFPLGGNRKGTFRTYINIMIVFLVSGIWHGANWTFFLWGLLHGILNCLNRLFRKSWSRVNIIIRWIGTFLAVDFTFIIFRADSVKQALLFFQQLFSFRRFSIRDELYQCYDLIEFQKIVRKIPVINVISQKISGFNMWVILLFLFLVILKFKNSKEISYQTTIIRALLTVFLLVWCIMSLAGVSEFLYFGF